MSERVTKSKYEKEECPMKRTMKRAVSIVLTCLMLVACALPVFAEDEQVDEQSITDVRYSTIDTPYASLSISGSTASCYSKLTAKRSVSLKIKMTLQKKSGSTWSNVQSWSASKTGTSLTLSKTKSVTSGSSYRLKVTFAAGSETVSQTVYP